MSAFYPYALRQRIEPAAEGGGIVPQGRDGSPSGPKIQARSAVSRSACVPPAIDKMRPKAGGVFQSQAGRLRYNGPGEHACPRALSGAPRVRPVGYSTSLWPHFSSIDPRGGFPQGMHPARVWQKAGQPHQ